MKFSMARQTKRNSEAQIKETGFVALARFEFIPQFTEWNSVMVGMQLDSFALAAACAAGLASVIIALEYCISPRHVELGLSQYFLLSGLAMFPMMSLFANTLSGTFGLSLTEVSGFVEVKRQILGDTSFGVHPRKDDNHAAASTVAKVLALICGNPQVNASIIRAGMISGIWNSNGPSHNFNCLRFNSGLLANWVNCLETPLAQAKGNQQPSQWYTTGRFIDYRRDRVPLITGISAQPLQAK